MIDWSRDRQPGARQYEGVDDGATVEPVDEVKGATSVQDAVVQQKAVRQQRRTEDQIRHGQGFHTRVNGADRTVADDRQAASR